jgi:putative ATP-dependent endonuclease of the OLD family
MHDATKVSVPIILRLTIQRFRGIRYLQWYPDPRMNVILGGGDVGKTTILEAIAVLLSPTNSMILSDADYWQRDIESGFEIEAVMLLPETSGISQQTKHAWPWRWDGHQPQFPLVDQDPQAAVNDVPAYRVRARGTADYDLMFEILEPDESTDHFSVNVRRKIGLVRLSGDDRNDRDLRLVQGSALERLISDKGLRSRLGAKLGQDKISAELKPDAQSKLSELSTSFQDHALPAGLDLGLTGGQGLSLNALIGLTAQKESVQLPLSSWGAGTRRWASLLISAAHHGDAPITLVDEIERGLEPYRQRALVAELQSLKTQVFITTHSSAALSAASTDALWYMDIIGRIGRLPRTVSAHVARDPETFLARIAIVAEGESEMGFVRTLLCRAIGNNLLHHGIWLTDGRGNDNTLTLLEATESGIRFAGFADNEERHPDKWAAVMNRLQKLVFRWQTGCLESNILTLVPKDKLEQFIQDPDGESGARMRTLSDRLNMHEDKSFSSVAARAHDLTQLIIEAATGFIPPEKQNAVKGEKNALKKSGQVWFKSASGGEELATKMFQFGLWPHLRTQLLPFLNAVLSSVSLPAISDL